MKLLIWEWQNYSYHSLGRDNIASLMVCAPEWYVLKVESVSGVLYSCGMPVAFWSLHEVEKVSDECLTE